MKMVNEEKNNELKMKKKERIYKAVGLGVATVVGLLQPFLGVASYYYIDSCFQGNKLRDLKKKYYYLSHYEFRKEVDKTFKKIDKNMFYIFSSLLLSGLTYFYGIMYGDKIIKQLEYNHKVNNNVVVESSVNVYDSSLRELPLTFYVVREIGGRKISKKLGLDYEKVVIDYKEEKVRKFKVNNTILNLSKKPYKELKCEFMFSGLTKSVKGLEEKLVETKPEKIIIKENNSKYDISKNPSAKQLCLTVFKDVVKHQHYK